jgi:mono/diheme cytochrome c family protein
MVDPDAGPTCSSNRDFFAQRVWPSVFGSTCISCHAPDGVAVEESAAFHLLPASYPGFIEANLAAVEEMAKNEYEGVPLLMAKPTGIAKHGGGTLMKEGDAAYQLLDELITRLREGEPCESKPSEADLGDVELMTATETFRKATLHLAGRLPTSAEQKELEEKGDDALPALLDDLMKEEAFYARLKEMFNDVFLTDRYFPNDEAVNLLNDRIYERAGEWFDSQTDDQKRAINRAVAREPLELLTYIVRNNKPFTEILTAKYTVVNPYSAQLYDLDLNFKDPSNENEWHETRVRVLTEDGARVTLPHAGLLTNPMWMNRFPTSDTNKNRHRARMVMQQFLATDILNIAERPIDPAESTQYNNPTRDDPSCASCHRQLDPIAGAFMKWDEGDQDEYVPEREWYREMYAPGFGDELMPVDAYDAAQLWLGKRIVDDPRFSLAMVRHMYSALTGHKPLAYPRQGADRYRAQLSAWETQDIVFRKLIDEFVAKDYNLRTIIRGVVLTPYFRAKNAVEELYGDEIIALEDIGTGRLSIPELLDRKVLATVGLRWSRDWDDASYLRSEYSILYGGIDSNNVTSRLTEVNGVMAGVQWRMANEVSCLATPRDFTKKKSARNLFKYVDLTTTPIAEDGSDDVEGVEQIMKNIRYLHEHFWGSRPDKDDPELEATYQLFLETWREGIQGVANDKISERIPYSCQVRRELATGEDLPEAERLELDPQYTVRAWMAVVTYLMSDFQFLYE